jgi:hypothetical protein
VGIITNHHPFPFNYLPHNTMNTSSGSSSEVLECIRFKDCEDKCACARIDANSTQEGCRNDAGFFNYAEFNYCTMGDLLPLSLTILVCMGLMREGAREEWGVVECG